MTLIFYHYALAVICLSILRAGSVVNDSSHFASPILYGRFSGAGYLKIKRIILTGRVVKCCYIIKVFG